MNLLQDFNILVTRPEPDASRLAKKLQQAGARTYLYSVLKIVPLFPKDQLNTVLKQEDSIFIFVSKHAVASIFQIIKALPETSQVLAIGPGTAQELTKYHIKAIIPSCKNYSTESLLNLTLLNHVKDRNVTIFSGEDGRTVLQETLKQRGANVAVVPVYRRVHQTENNLSLSDWQENRINIIITTSIDSLKALIALLTPEQQLWLKQQKLVVISARMADFAKKLGFLNHQLIIAANATDQEIIDAIIHYKKCTRI